MAKLVVGVLIGGASSRMAGAPKGLLPLKDGETIIERTLRIAREAQLEVVLVGDLTAYDAIAKTPRVLDAKGVQGPLAGLSALLEHAADRDAIALACDMPFVSVALLQRLATESPAAIVLAPRSVESNKWEPLCARYRSPIMRNVLRDAIDNHEHSFQQLFKRTQITELSLSAEERSATIDWDSPNDITR